MREWKPIVAGVDATDEGAWAGATAWRLAYRARVPCQLVNAIPAVWSVGAWGPTDAVDVAELQQAVFREVQVGLESALRDQVPAEALDNLLLRVGRPARVLADVAGEMDAGLVVLGAKYHNILERWLGGSTVLAAARTLPVPLLAATSSSDGIRRVLAAVDLSEAAGPTIAAAEEYASLFNAALRIVHVIEPLPLASDVMLQTRVQPWTDKILAADIWPRVTLPGTERVVRHGTARTALEAEVAEWQADLLVVGSHGRGWIDRTFLGSVAEGLLKDLPTSVLVVPVRQPKALGMEVREEAGASAGR